jgi:DNA repair exonuclease SbcCD ATPase subunit
VDEKQLQALDRQHRELALALPALRRLYRERQHLREASTGWQELDQSITVADAEAQRYEAERQPLIAELQAAEQARASASERVVRARAHIDMARERAERFRRVSGGAVCGYCGQTLSAEHRDTEWARIQQEVAASEEELAVAQQALNLTREGEFRLRESNDAARAASAAAKRRAEALRREYERTGDQLRRHTEACQEAYCDLRPLYRTYVAQPLPADWLQTVYPTEEELNQLAVEQTSQENHVESLRRAIAARRDRMEGVRRDSLGAENYLNRVQQETRDLEQTLRQEMLQDELRRQRQADALQTLPPNWRALAEEVTGETLRSWHREHEVLTARDAGGRLNRLREVQTGLGALTQRLRQLQEEAESIPVESRRNPSEMELHLQKARSEERRLVKQRQSQETVRDALLARQRRHDELSEDFRKADRQRHLYARLTELLGHQQLQRHLVRQAERGVVENANLILDRLSGGQLTLRLRRDDSDGEDQALHLAAFKPAEGQSFGLSFLSGSERFRIAVSLALGIGQYASRQYRPIESIIIDEGFGCLDRDNRAAMIEELKRLQGSLRCILLVSHQEEFAEAFPDGYHFEMEGGATKVSRFRR